MAIVKNNGIVYNEYKNRMKKKTRKQFEPNFKIKFIDWLLHTTIQDLDISGARNFNSK